MSTGMKFAKFAGIVVLCLGSLSTLYADSTHTQRKTKKPQLPPPLPSGPLGPVPQIPLDSIAPVPPQVSFQNGQLSIVAPNSTLGDILRAVRKQTGAEIEIPAANDRVVTHLGPGPVRDVMAELLNGSRFNYVLLGSAENASLLTRVVLVAKTGQENGGPNTVQPGQPGPMQAGNMPPQATEDAANDAVDAEATEDNPDENADQPEQAEQAEQPAASPDQPGVKTPQQMLQEMQQRQLQLQQQQPQGQPQPVPPPARAPQEQ
jgi:hypothetical protein